MSDYPNRTDLQNPAMSAAKGQTYGTAKKQMDAQRAVPIGPSPTTYGSQPPPVVQPGSLGDFARPGDPTQPITAGADFGPGINAAQAGIPMLSDPRQEAMDEIRTIYRLYQTPGLAELIQFYESN
jgi:hypothetical protein